MWGSHKFVNSLEQHHVLVRHHYHQAGGDLFVWLSPDCQFRVFLEVHGRQDYAVYHRCDKNGQEDSVSKKTTIWEFYQGLSPHLHYSASTIIQKKVFPLLVNIKIYCICTHNFLSISLQFVLFSSLFPQFVLALYWIDSLKIIRQINNYSTIATCGSN